MIIYWMMYFIPVFALLYPERITDESRKWMWYAVCIFFVLVIGLRHESGGDWIQYLETFNQITGRSHATNMIGADPAFKLLIQLSGFIGWGIYGVNVLSAAIVMTGVYFFSQRQPEPWLALAVAVPYFLIVVSMGYTRQSIAIGISLLAFVALADRNLLRYFLLIACAGLFHKAAVLLLPLGILSSTDKKTWVIVSMIIMSVLLGGVLLLEHYERLMRGYLDTTMKSEGGAIRVAMNAVPAMLFLLYANRFAPDKNERRLWTWVAIFSLICVPLVGFASTAVDRVALYFLPIQLFVYSRIGCLFRHSTYDRTVAVVTILAVYALVEWVMLNKAHIVSKYWVPYDNILFYWVYYLTGF